MKVVNQFKNKIKRIYYTNFKKDIFMINIYRWFDIQGDETIRLDYPLNENSVVFDIGGFHGDFAAKILCKYNSNILIFEPIYEYYNLIKNRFLNNSKVKIYNIGLSNNTLRSKISKEGSSSSIFKSNTNQYEYINLVSISEFINSNSITNIDLMKINIEGGEYDLLTELLEKGMINISKYYQIQFHPFIKDANNKREKIRSNLSRTHSIQWEFPFVWESWERNN